MKNLPVNLTTEFMFKPLDVLERSKMRNVQSGLCMINVIESGKVATGIYPGAQPISHTRDYKDNYREIGWFHFK